MVSLGDCKDAQFIISMRVERPIENCELVPYCSLNVKGTNVDNIARAKLLEANPHTFEYKWYRGPSIPLCGNGACVRNQSFDPEHYAKNVLTEPVLGCAVCERAGQRKEANSFCCVACLKQGWKKHASTCHCNTEEKEKEKDKDSAGGGSRFQRNARSHKNGGSPGVAVASNANTNTNTNTNTVTSDPATWKLVCSSPSYAPTAADVGCCIKIEVYAHLTNKGASAAAAVAPAVVETKGSNKKGGKSAKEKEKEKAAAAAAAAAVEALAGPYVHFTSGCLASPKAPPKRPIYTVSNPKMSGNSLITSNSVRMKLVSYNCLAELYATKSIYPHCDAWILNWSYRCNLLLRELYDTQGDVICLQEVQTDHFEQHIYPAMVKDGYEGVFKQKSRESMGQYGKVDGCATFWKKSKFQLVEDTTVDFNECSVRAGSNMNMSEMETRKFITRTSKDNIAQIVVLESLNSRAIVSAAQQASLNRINALNNASARSAPSDSSIALSAAKVCIVNTHIYSNQSHPDVKLWQTWMLLQEVTHFCSMFQQKQQQLHLADTSAIAQELGLIICGDFNSEPTSAVYELMKYGQIESNYPELDVGLSDFGGGGGGGGSDYGSAVADNPYSSSYSGISDRGSKHGKCRVLPDLENITHSLELASVMETAFGSEPEFTNYTINYKGTLDYMFYTPGTIKVLAVTELPDEYALSEINIGLPNVFYPSDHVMLCADVSLAVNVIPTTVPTPSSSVPSQLATTLSQQHLSTLLGITGSSANGATTTTNAIQNQNIRNPKRFPNVNKVLTGMTPGRDGGSNNNGHGNGNKGNKGGHTTRMGSSVHG